MTTQTLRTKVIFCGLAMLTGAFGGHWKYVQHTRWIWYVLLFPVSMLLGWVDAIRFGLMPDEQFNRRFNQTFAEHTPQTTPVVIGMVITSLGLAVISLLCLIIFGAQLFTLGSIG